MPGSCRCCTQGRCLTTFSSRSQHSRICKVGVDGDLPTVKRTPDASTPAHQKLSLFLSSQPRPQLQLTLVRPSGSLIPGERRGPKRATSPLLRLCIPSPSILYSPSSQLELVARNSPDPMETWLSGSHIPRSFALLSQMFTCSAFRML